jgi:nucleotide-binding universal stress UspA family protein
MYERILVPVDGSAAALRGLTEALQLAKGLNASVRMLHVVDEFISDMTLGPANYYDKWIEAVRERGKVILREALDFAKERGEKPEAVLVDTYGRRAADVIIEQAAQWPADLIVMGTHGRRGMRRLLMGSDAELVLRGARVPVLMVRESGDADKDEAVA